MNYKEITHTVENERRKAKRININVTIQLKSIDPEHPASSVEVNITDISTTGMAFRSDYPFELGPCAFINSNTLRILFKASSSRSLLTHLVR